MEDLFQILVNLLITSEKNLNLAVKRASYKLDEVYLPIIAKMVRDPQTLRLLNQTGVYLSKGRMYNGKVDEPYWSEQYMFAPMTCRQILGLLLPTGLSTETCAQKRALLLQFASIEELLKEETPDEKAMRYYWQEHPDQSCNRYICPRQCLRWELNRLGSFLRMCGILRNEAKEFYHLTTYHPIITGFDDIYS